MKKRTPDLNEQKICIITGIILAVFCAAFVIFRGGTYTVTVDAAGSAAAEDYDILTDHGESILKIADKRISGGKLKITMKSRAQGTGSRTKAYFWINAFIREFIATLYAQRKKHIKVIALIFILTLFTVTLVFISGLF